MAAEPTSNAITTNKGRHHSEPARPWNSQHTSLAEPVITYISERRDHVPAGITCRMSTMTSIHQPCGIC